MLSSFSSTFTYLLLCSINTMSDELSIKSVDMPNDMQDNAVAITKKALDKYTVEKDIAQYIKKEFDKMHKKSLYGLF